MPSFPDDEGARRRAPIADAPLCAPIARRRSRRPRKSGGTGPDLLVVVIDDAGLRRAVDTVEASRYRVDIVCSADERHLRVPQSSGLLDRLSLGYFGQPAKSPDLTQRPHPAQQRRIHRGSESTRAGCEDSVESGVSGCGSYRFIYVQRRRRAFRAPARARVCEVRRPRDSGAVGALPPNALIFKHFICAASELPSRFSAPGNPPGVK